MARRSGTRTGFIAVRVARSVHTWRRRTTATRGFHDEYQRDDKNENGSQESNNVDEGNHRSLTLDHAIENAKGLSRCGVPVRTTRQKKGPGAIERRLGLRRIE